MATNDQKFDALKSAIEIAKESARAGSGSPEHHIERSYNMIVKILDEIEKKDKK